MTSENKIQPPGTTVSKELTNLAKNFYRRYGLHVNEDRAMPALMDGMKPVQRRIL